MNPKQFQRYFIEWMQSWHKFNHGEIIAIDEKTVGDSYDKGKDRGVIHMVSSFSAANELVLGQIKVNAKRNEITAILGLLELFGISGCLVTIDAMGCQRDIASNIVDKRADYLLAVKGNQGKLHKALENQFSSKKINDWKGDSFKSHGCLEVKQHLVSDIFNEFVNLSFDWKGMQTLGIFMSVRMGSEIFDPDDIIPAPLKLLLCWLGSCTSVT